MSRQSLLEKVKEVFTEPKFKELKWSITFQAEQASRKRAIKSLVELIENYNELKDTKIILDGVIPQFLEEGLKNKSLISQLKNYFDTVKLKRYTTRKKAEQDKVLPFKLYEEAIEKYKKRIEANPKRIYLGFNFAGTSAEQRYKSKSFLLVHLIEGWMIYELMKQYYFNVKLYFTPEEKNATSREEKNRIKREIVLALKEMDKKPAGKKLLEKILQKGGFATVKVPSASKNEYYNVELQHLPLAYGRNRKKAYSNWSNFDSTHYCEFEQYRELNYIRPNERWLCRHVIAAAFAVMEQQDREYCVNAPYIMVIPFVRPSDELRKIYEGLKHCFVRKRIKTKTGKIGIRHRHLTLLEKEFILIRAVLYSIVPLF